MDVGKMRTLLVSLPVVCLIQIVVPYEQHFVDIDT